MPTAQVMEALGKQFLSQLRQKSKIKSITVDDLHSLISQIWITPENFEILICESTISTEEFCQFYMDFHAKDDIDERLNKVND